MCLEHSFGHGSSPLSEYPAARHPSEASFRKCPLTSPRMFAGTSFNSSKTAGKATSENLGATPRLGRFDATTERGRRDCRGRLGQLFPDGVPRCDPSAHAELLDLQCREVLSRASLSSDQHLVFFLPWRRHDLATQWLSSLGDFRREHPVHRDRSRPGSWVVRLPELPRPPKPAPRQGEYRARFPKCLGEVSGCRPRVEDRLRRRCRRVSRPVRRSPCSWATRTSCPRMLLLASDVPHI